MIATSTDYSLQGINSTRRAKISKAGGIEGVSKTLTKSLDSRRSSSNSKKAVPTASSSVRAASLEIPPDNAGSLNKDAQVVVASGSGVDQEVRSPRIDNLLGP